MTLGGWASKKEIMMRTILAIVAAATVAGFTVSAEAAPLHKRTNAVAHVQQNPGSNGEEFGYQEDPDHYKVGSSDWWHAMDNEGRGGAGH